MKYDRFEDLPVWNSSMELATRVYALTKDRVFAGPGDLTSQLRRAALSVSNNIAEGFERGTTAELLMFLYIARGSAGEVRSMLHFVERMVANGTPVISNLKSHISDRATPETSTLKSEISDHGTPEISNMKSHISDRAKGIRTELVELKAVAESCSRQIRAWADSLQNSDIKGQRHLSQAVREKYDADRRAANFWNQVDTAMNARSGQSEGPQK